MCNIGVSIIGNVGTTGADWHHPHLFNLSLHSPLQGSATKSQLHELFFFIGREKDTGTMSVVSCKHSDEW